MVALRLSRVQQTPRATLGRLTLHGVAYGVTLEDPPGEGKGPIPAGTYPITLRWSDRFQMLVPGLQNVPGFEDIELHAGNTARDTTGCVLVGTHQVDPGTIADSRTALGRLLARWRDWIDQEISISDDFAPPEATA